MKGDKFYEIKRLIAKKLNQTFKRPYLAKSEAKDSYCYQVCCLLCKTGYLKRLKWGTYLVLRDTTEIWTYRELFQLAYNKDKYKDGVKI